jgi:opacity protein-like surface antigen
MTKKTTGMAAVVTAAVAVAGLVPQQAMAESHYKGTSAQADIERRLQMMEDEMRALRSELAKARSEARTNAERMEAQQQKVDQQLAEAEEHQKEHHDLLFFRGGYAKMEHGRGYKTQAPETLLANTEWGDNDGWYVGAGFDHRLSDDFWGLTDMVSVDGEVMFEYKNFGTGTNTLVGIVNDAVAPVGTIENKITQLTLTAAPKIKFNNLGNFRPWIIPFGLGIHIISPPSSGVTVLNPGLMLGAGAEYKIWGDLWAGLDFRYHFTGDDLDFKSKNGAVTLKGVDTDGLTAGAYLGFGF